MSESRIASRYAKSLIELAQEQGKLDRVKEDVDAFLEALESRDFALLLKSPIVHADKKWQILKTLFEGKFDELTMAFLRILLRKGREPYLAHIAQEFIHQYKRLKHISTVKLITAVPLSPQTVESVRKVLEESRVTDEHVEILTEVDPDIIGGFVLEFDDKLYDASVKHKLELLKKEFLDNLYISKIIAQ